MARTRCPQCGKRHNKFPRLCWSQASGPITHLVILFTGMAKPGYRISEDHLKFIECMQENASRYPHFNMEYARNSVLAYAAMKGYISALFPDDPESKGG